MTVPTRAAAALVLAAILTAGCPPPSEEPVYFVVSERNFFRGESFIVLLTDPENVAHARDIIRDPDTAESQILVCSVAGGSGDPPNQDVLNDGQLWSWHVDAFIEFADFTAEILDGWPGFLEEDFDGWVANTGGMIGFWGYTASREISEEELRGMSGAR